MVGLLTLAPGIPGSPVRPSSPSEPLVPVEPGPPLSPTAPCVQPHIQTVIRRIVTATTAVRYGGGGDIETFNGHGSHGDCGNAKPSW